MSLSGASVARVWRYRNLIITIIIITNYHSYECQQGCCSIRDKLITRSSSVSNQWFACS